MDTPLVREAFLRHLDDDGDDTAGEAARGLAARKDPRVYPTLVEHLADPEVGYLYVEAAQELADPRLLHLLRALGAAGWDGGANLDDAIGACAAAGQGWLAEVAAYPVRSHSGQQGGPQRQNSLRVEIKDIEPARLPSSEVAMSISLDSREVQSATAVGTQFAGELRAQVRRASLALEVAACRGEDVLEHPAWGRIAELLDIARRHNVEL